MFCKYKKTRITAGRRGRLFIAYFFVSHQRVHDGPFEIPSLPRPLGRQTLLRYVFERLRK